MRLLRNHLIALTHQYVHHSLRTDDLRRRCNKRRLTEILTNTRNLLKNILKLIILAGLMQLRNEVGKHAARYLIQHGSGVDAKNLRAHKAVLDALLAIRSEEIGDLLEKTLIQSSVIRCAAECFDHDIRRRL